MAKIGRIGHDHQALFQILHVVVLVVLLLISGGDTRQKQTTTWPIYLRPPRFLKILDPYKMTSKGPIRSAPTPLNPPYKSGGGAKEFLWDVITD